MNRPRKLPTQQRSRNTVETLLEAAAQVFSREGATATTNRIVRASHRHSPRKPPAGDHRTPSGPPRNHKQAQPIRGTAPHLGPRLRCRRTTADPSPSPKPPRPHRYRATATPTPHVHPPRATPTSARERHPHRHAQHEPGSRATQTNSPPVRTSPRRDTAEAETARTPHIPSVQHQLDRPCCQLAFTQHFYRRRGH